MVTAESEFQDFVPIKIEDVVVGRAIFAKHRMIQIEITAPGTYEFLHENVILGLIEGLSVSPDFIPAHEEILACQGHLRLLKESRHGNEEAATCSSPRQAQ